MPVDQAIFTSINRRGKSGYQLASRSPGVTESEATALTKWCPSHGALNGDRANCVSVNFHGLPGGRYALSRTCEGPPEYSGRGGRQVFTRAVLVDPETYRRSGHRPFLLYRDALALGHLTYVAAPEPALPCPTLSSYYPPRARGAPIAFAREMNLGVFDGLLNQIQAGQPVVVAYDGDRTAFAESLLERIEESCLRDLSFTTSLLPSSVRPYQISVVPPGR